MAENTGLQKQEQESRQLTISEKFTNKIMEQFGGNVAGDIQITDYQRRLIQGYFIGIDRALKMAEERRIAKNKSNQNHSYDEQLSVTWNNVNLNDLALDLVHYARIGLDMMQENHLFPIPFKNNKTNKYDINLMEGYNGIQYIAEYYAVEKPKSVTVELVYSNDVFRPIKRCCNNQTDSYEFEIKEPFNRGKVVGGFGYIEYEEPRKNKLIIMTLADILKRKPEYAAPEFWGGKKSVWKNGQKTEEDTDGWFNEMCLKTLKREVFSAKNMPRDPQKIDDTYHYLKEKELRNAEREAQAEIDEKAGRIIIDANEPINAPIEEQETPMPPEIGEMSVDDETGEIISEKQENASEDVSAIQQGQSEVAADTLPIDEPDF